MKVFNATVIFVLASYIPLVAYAADSANQVSYSTRQEALIDSTLKQTDALDNGMSSTADLASIHQVSDGNFAAITQFGNRNHADISQSGGSSNIALITQVGNNLTALIVQQGSKNIALINQR